MVFFPSLFVVKVERQMNYDRIGNMNRKGVFRQGKEVQLLTLSLSSSLFLGIIPLQMEPILLLVSVQ